MKLFDVPRGVLSDVFYLGLAELFAKYLVLLVVIPWDLVLDLLNKVLPRSEPDTVVPPPAYGHNGVWPAYVPPGPGDSRSACPMLNAMANHGILPHDGKNIPFRVMSLKIRDTFNFAPSFCFYVPHYAAGFLQRSYFRGTVDLEEISMHGKIEHDASLTRHDVALEKDQGAPNPDLVRGLLDHATGQSADCPGLILTQHNLAEALLKREVSAKASNPRYSMKWEGELFGAANSSTMLTIFGGRINDLKVMLYEERFPENWQPRVLDYFGLTMKKFNGTVLPVLKYKHKLSKREKSLKD